MAETGGRCIRLKPVDTLSQFPQDQVGFSRIETDLDPLYLGMVFIMGPHRVTDRRAAVEAVDDPKPVNGGVGAAEAGVYRRDGLGTGHIVDIYFGKSADRDNDRPLLVR